MTDPLLLKKLKKEAREYSDGTLKESLKSIEHYTPEWAAILKREFKRRDKVKVEFT